MTSTSLTILDYGAGNLRSVQKAFEFLGYEARITSAPDDVAHAQAIVFPGQGASDAAMAALQHKGLVQPLLEAIHRGTPFLGVCLGLQMLMETSEEGGNTQCLGVFNGRVRRLPQGPKVPHMGWNDVRIQETHPLFHDVPKDAQFYFVHSYYADFENDALVLGTTEYGTNFCSVATRDNLIATQFHPEKSGPVGLKLYDNFVRYIVEKGTPR